MDYLNGFLFGGDLVNFKEIESILQSYTLEEILEYNDVSPEDALEFLVDEGFVDLPTIKPLEFNDE